jgi:hypothetical protein
MRILLFVAAMLALCLPAKAELVQVPSRAGVTVPISVEPPARGEARAWVLLFVGAEGNLKLDASGGPTSPLATIFIIQSRQHLKTAGLGVVLVDAPSDRRDAGMNPQFRRAPEHLQDVGAVVAAIRQRFGKPVWLFGHSNGGITAAIAGRSLQGEQRPDGLILSSATVIRVRAKPDQPLPAIPYTGPVLIMAHKNDNCSHSPYADSLVLAEAFPQARPKTLLSFDGPTPANSKDHCARVSTHGFYGQEAEAMQAIAEFVLNSR